MQSIAKTAVGYLRTSSQVNAGDKGSQARQRAAIKAFAKQAGLTVVDWFYDQGVSGAVPIKDREQFGAMLDRLYANCCKVVLIESVSRLARDIEVQETAARVFREKGYELIPVDSPDLFTSDDPGGMRKLIRGMLGVIAAFERDGVVHKLKVARDRASKELGRRVEGRKPVPPAVVKEARRLYRRSPKTGRRRSYGAVARELAALGHFGPSGGPYFPTSIKRMVTR